MDPLMIAVSHAVNHKASRYMVEEEIQFRLWKRSRTINTSMLYGLTEWGTAYGETGFPEEVL